MTIKQPLWYIIAFLSVGITIGHSFQSPWFLAVALSILLYSTILSISHKGRGWSLILFWLIFGAALSSIEQVHTNLTSSAWHSVQAKALLQSDVLHMRLKQSGLPDEDLSLGSALLLGKREGLTQELRQAYSESGVAHLLALSGLHLGILYGLLHILIIQRIRFSQWRWFALPPLLLLLWGYVLLTGLPLSLVRAAGMCTVVMIATLAQRELWSTHALSLSVLIILLISPSSLFSISFQLSFLAVFFIIFICQQPACPPTFSVRFRQMVYVSAAAQLGTAPLAAYYFHTLPLLSIPLSLILIPVSTLIVYLSLATLLIPIPLLSTSLSYLVHWQNHLVTLCASIPGAVIRDLYPQLWHILVVYAILLIAIIRLNAYREKMPLTDIRNIRKHDDE